MSIFTCLFLVIIWYNESKFKIKGLLHMRTLKYAILGLIKQSPMTGYDITNEFNKELIHFWNAKHSQIYPELKKLVTEGLITYKTEISGEVLEKKVYSITEKGTKEFQEWLMTDDKIEPTAKDRFRLKMYFSTITDKETLLRLLNSQTRQHFEKLSSLRERFNQYEGVPDFSDSRFGDYIVLEGAVMREENYLEWLQKCLDYL